MLAAAQGRLNQRSSSRALSDLADVVNERDAETRRLVATFEQNIAALRLRVEALESALLESERSKRARGFSFLGGACRRVRAWLLARLGIKGKDQKRRSSM